MRKIEFYKNIDGKNYVKEFLDSLTGKEAQKVIWTLKVIEDLDIVPKQYFKKLKNSEDIWEVRVDGINKTYRILGFFYKQELIILNHAFIKKTQKTPRNAIEIAIERKNDYLRRKK